MESPDCLNVTVGVPEPASLSTLISHFPEMSGFCGASFGAVCARIGAATRRAAASNSFGRMRAMRIEAPGKARANVACPGDQPNCRSRVEEGRAITLQV